MQGPPIGVFADLSSSYFVFSLLITTSTGHLLASISRIHHLFLYHFCFNANLFVILLHMLLMLRLADRVRTIDLHVINLYHSSNTCAIDIVDGDTDSMTGSNRFIPEQHTVLIRREATAAVVKKWVALG